MTVAEIMALDKPGRQHAITRMLEEQFPSAMINRFVADCIDACRAGPPGIAAIEAVMKQAIPRFYGFVQQIDPGLEDVPPAQRELFTWTMAKVLLLIANERIPTGPGGGRRVAA